MSRPRLALRSPTGELLRNASGEVFAVEAPGPHLIQRAAPLRTNNSSDVTPYGFAADVRAGSLLTLQIANYLTGLASITDNRGNTWQRAATNGDESNFAEIWYAMNAAPGPTTLTIRPTSTGFNYLSGILQEWGGMATSGALDATGLSSTGSVSTAATTTETLVLLAVVADVGVNPTGYQTPTGVGAWTLNDTAQNSTFDSGFLAAHLVASAAGVQTASGWNPLNTSSESVLAAFKAAYPEAPGDLNASRVEVVTPTDTANATATKTASRAEAVAPVDTSSASGAFSASAGDAVTPSDAQSQATGALRSLDDALAPSDTSLATFASDASVAETVTPTDAADATTQGEYVASRADALTPADATAAGLSAVAALAETFGVTDAASASMDTGEYAAAASDTTTPTDQTAASATLQASVVEGVTVTDFPGLVLNYAVAAIDEAFPFDQASATIGQAPEDQTTRWWFTVPARTLRYSIAAGSYNFTPRKPTP
jgi:hypothetical protein